MEFKELRYPVRRCHQNDFGSSTKAKELFESWNGFILVCPDLKKEDRLKFEGDLAAMVSKSIGVKFEMCTGEKCANDKVEWLKDVQIDTWVVEEMIDYLKYEGRPTILIQRRLTSNVFAEKIESKITPS